MISVEQMKLAEIFQKMHQLKDITTAAKPSEAEKCSRQEEQPDRLINDFANIHLPPTIPPRNLRASS